MKNDDLAQSTFSPHDLQDRQWHQLFNELCYEVFYKSEYGKRLLALMENKYFRSPVASPNREPSWAYFNEGRNELIRSFTHGVQSHLIENQAIAHAKKNPLPRRAKIKPIPNEG